MFYLLKKRTEPVYTFDFFTNGNTKMMPCLKLEIHVPKHHVQYSSAVFVWMPFQIYPNFCSSYRPSSFHLPTEFQGYKTHMRQETPPFQIQLPAANEGLSWGPLVNMQQKTWLWLLHLLNGNKGTTQPIAVFVSVCWDRWCLEPAKMLPNSFPQQTVAWYFVGFILNGRCLEFRRMVISFQHLSIIFLLVKPFSNLENIEMAKEHQEKNILLIIQRGWTIAINGEVRKVGYI